MAYTQNPALNTYKTERFLFSSNPLQRNGTSTKDQRFVNAFTDIIKEGDKASKTYAKKRPGTAFGTSFATAGEGRGIFLFKGVLFTAVGNKLYRGSTAVVTFTTTTGTVGFAEGVSSTYAYLFVCDGISAWVIKTDGTVTQVTDVDLPTPHVPQPVYIDGYIVIAKANTADLYNCALQDPLNWVVGEFITAEMYPDNVIGLTKINNYILAFGKSNVEFFYDNANATGTPFERYPAAVQNIGTAASDSIAQIEKECIFISDSAGGEKSVWMIEGFRSKDIGSEAVKNSVNAEGTAVSSAHGFIVRVAGHKFYILNLTSRTWVYDFEQAMWHEWQYNSGVFPFNFATDNASSTPSLVEKNTGFTVTLSPTVYQDNIASSGTYPIVVTLVTDKMDFGNFNRKFCHRLNLLGDVPDDTTTTVFFISYSDDDFKTYSTEISLLFGISMSTIHQLGSFRRRAFKIRYVANLPMRLEGFELDINMGQS